ncbi:hypothetical protein H8959_004119 [Pygathrix nigripes]
MSGVCWGHTTLDYVLLHIVSYRVLELFLNLSVSHLCFGEAEKAKEGLWPSSAGAFREDVCPRDQMCRV